MPGRPFSRLLPLASLALAAGACASGCLTARIRYDEDAPPRAAAAVALAAEHAEGARERFLQYTGDGRVAGDLDSIARLYRRDDGAEVLLLAMVHYADPSFYEAVAGRIAGADVVLLEGMAGPSGEGVRAPSEPGAAPGGAPGDPPEEDETAAIFGALALVPQPEGAAIGPAGPRYERGDVPAAELFARVAAARREAESGEGAEFPSRSFGWDRFWYGAFGRAERFRKAWRHAFATRLSPAAGQPIRDLLIDPRNDALLAKVDAEVRARPKTPAGRAFRVVVPWGAEHMPGIERGLFARRFAPAGSERIMAWRVRSYAVE